MKTKEGNKLIAEFMGLKLHYDYGYCGDKYFNTAIVYEDGNVLEPEYHTSWDWLMPVVGKIKEMLIGNHKLRIKADKECIITHYSILTPIDEVYKAVIEFIEWHKKAVLNDSSKGSSPAKQKEK